MRELFANADFQTNPFHILNEVERDMRRMLDLMPTRQSSVAKEGRSLQSSLRPSCDVMDRDSDYQLCFDLPGVKREDIKIEVQDGKLYLTGERKSEMKNGDYTEKSYGQFERVMTLPQGVEQEKIEANFRDGVLSISIPKAEKAKAKQIEINDQSSDSKSDGGKQVGVKGGKAA